MAGSRYSLIGILLSKNWMRLLELEAVTSSRLQGSLNSGTSLTLPEASGLQLKEKWFNSGKTLMNRLSRQGL